MFDFLNLKCPNYDSKNRDNFVKSIYFNYAKVAVVTSIFWIILAALGIRFYFADCLKGLDLELDCVELQRRAELYNHNNFDYLGQRVASSLKNYPVHVQDYECNKQPTIKKKSPLKVDHFIHPANRVVKERSAVTNDNEEQTTNDEGYEYDDKSIDRSLFVDNGEGDPGHNGSPVDVPPELEEQAKEMFKINQFNLVASDMISPNRTLPDVRPDICKIKEYSLDELPNTSVIIVFHNEAWSTLIRTLWSVINRSPLQLVHEIILVDDASERDYLGTQLDEYITHLPVATYVERMGNRSGLVRSRLRGVGKATGQTITFLDAHCECTIGWLEPLLYQVHIDRKSVISPLIDVITDNTFEYRLVPDLLAGFDWKVLFDWAKPREEEMERRKDDATMPFRTPAMAGGLLTMDRDYFYEIGSYDDQMNIWGGENLEMSFRLWQCGGQVLISPCSRVGHVFRSISPYTFPDGTDRTVLTNQMRTMEVWLGDHKKFYYKSNPAAPTFDVGDLTTRLELKKKLKCKNFVWYLDHVYPDSPLPRNFYSVGKVKNIDSNLCLYVSTDGKLMLGLKDCTKEVDRQVFAYTSDLTLKTTDKMCVTVLEVPRLDLALRPCEYPVPELQIWDYHDDHRMSLGNPKTNQCLAVLVQDTIAGIVYTVCGNQSMERWSLEEYTGSLYGEDYEEDEDGGGGDNDDDVVGSENDGDVGGATKNEEEQQQHVHEDGEHLPGQDYGDL